MLKHYEGMFVLHNRDIPREEDDPEPPGPEEVVRRLLEKAGASVAHTVPWANRKLAYPIRGNQTGSYVLTYFSGEADVCSKLDREVRIHDRLLRHMAFGIDTIPGEQELPGPLADHGSRSGPPERAPTPAPTPAPATAPATEPATEPATGAVTEGAAEGGVAVAAPAGDTPPEGEHRRPRRAPIDYKNVYFLRRQVTPQGKIYSRVRSGMDARHQHRLRKAIIRARVLALLPFIGR